MNKVSSLIAIDPGSIKIGIAYFKNEQLIKSEQIKLSGKSFYSRLRALKSAVERFFSEYSSMDYVAIETPYIGRNPQSGLKLGQARGIILAVAFDYDIEIIDISPQEIRSYYGVKTNSKKEIYQGIVKIEFAKSLKNLTKIGEDEADAIAIGSTAIYKIKQAELYKKANK